MKINPKITLPTHPSIGCVIVTLNATKHLHKCLPPLLNSPLKPRVLVVDSSSDDNTVAIAEEMGAETLVISRSHFNHGTTRELARHHLATDIVTMHTQDAYLIDENTLEKLVDPIMKGKAAASYARQLPHPGASFFEAFARDYNYPQQGHIRTIKDIETHGIYTFFCSNSCAAYINKALDDIGGFPHVLLGEDTVAVAKLLRQGYPIAYAAEALAHHSHDYTLLQEFKRNFDTGLARKGYENLMKAPSGKDAATDQKRGKDFAMKMLATLARQAPIQIPYAIAHLSFKWLGYKVGRSSQNAPVWLKKALSSQPYYHK